MVTKKLAEMKAEQREYEDRYKMVTYQISQLKEEIDTKQVELLKENAEHKKKNKIIDETNKAITRILTEIKQKGVVITEMDEKIKSLQAMIKDSESRRQKLQDDHKMVVAERDILSTQLIRRDAEAALLYEKIKISQSALAKGEAQYNSKLAEIEGKQQEIKRLSVQINNFKR
jgi:chromosome segregation ATPase